MRSWLRYLWRAFNARPFRMPIPPAWFGVAAFGVLGALLDPAFYLIGGGAIAVGAALVASNPRFQRAVDAEDVVSGEDPQASQLARLDADGRARQAELEQQCAALQQVLERAGAGGEHIRGAWQLVELHLRLLVARQAARAVVASVPGEDGGQLARQIRQIESRLAETDMDRDLRDALEGQAKVLRGRLEMRTEAIRRLKVLDAELERIRQQIALIREQALLAPDASGIARSVDALTAFLNESNRWLRDQQEIFSDLDVLAPDSFGPAGLPPARRQRTDKQAGELQ